MPRWSISYVSTQYTQLHIDFSVLRNDPNYVNGTVRESINDLHHSYLEVEFRDEPTLEPSGVILVKGRRLDPLLPGTVMGLNSSGEFELLKRNLLKSD
jgi:hypothetical protein